MIGKQINSFLKHIRAHNKKIIIKNIKDLNIHILTTADRL